MAEEIIRPGGKHNLNEDPHFARSLSADFPKDSRNPVTFLLKNGRRVKVYPMNNRTPLASPKKGFYTRLLLDEYAEAGGDFEPVTKYSPRAELIEALREDHRIHPDRFK